MTVRRPVGSSFGGPGKPIRSPAPSPGSAARGGLFEEDPPRGPTEAEKQLGRQVLLKVAETYYGWHRYPGKKYSARCLLGETPETAAGVTYVSRVTLEERAGAVRRSFRYTYRHVSGVPFLKGIAIEVEKDGTKVSGKLHATAVKIEKEHTRRVPA